MLSLVVFSIGALSLGHFQGYLIKSTSLAKQRTEALLEVNNVIESLKIGKLEEDVEGKKIIPGSTTTYTASWEKQNLKHGGTMLNTTISWPDRHFVDETNVPQASNHTTLNFTSMIADQLYSNESLPFKMANTTYVTLPNLKSSNNETGESLETHTKLVPVEHRKTQ